MHHSDPALDTAASFFDALFRLCGHKAADAERDTVMLLISKPVAVLE
jgi:hypothetical protein